jgi:hypothetical protein
VLLAASASAQVTTGTIYGRVIDPTGAVAPSASVEIRQLETGAVRTLTTDDRGTYRATALAVGPYEIRVEKADFSPEVRRGINLTVGQDAAVDFALKVGVVDQAVEVVADAPTVHTDGPALSFLVDEKKIRDLPLNGRSFTQLALLQPGVQVFKQERIGFIGGRGDKISISGGRPTDNVFLLDGTNANDLYNRTPGSSSGVFLGVETVREFSVVTNSYGAEYESGGGGVINAVTKSGTNEFHGSAFEFHRNSGFDARNFFDPASGPPEFNRNQFGATMGGPLQKDKTFFFAAYEGLYQDLANTHIVNVPSLAARDAAVPAAQPYIDLFPKPNLPTLSTNPLIAQYSFAFTEPTHEDFFQLRLDHALSSRHFLFARYTYDRADVTHSEPYPLFVEVEPSRNHYFTLEDKAILTSSTVNTARFAINHTHASVQNQPFPGVSIDPALSFTAGQPFGDLVVGGVTPTGSQFGTEPRIPVVADQKLYSLTDDLVWVKGRHTWKMGLLVERYAWDDVQDFEAFGEYLFPSINALMSAKPTRFTATLPGRAADRANRAWAFGAYVQDELQLTSRLKLNLGVRYSPSTVPADAQGRDYNLRNVVTDTQVTQGPLFRNPSWKNVGPRIGFAWDPTGDAKTSVRGGFGVYYDRLLQYVLTTARFQPPLFLTVNVNNPKFPSTPLPSNPPTSQLNIQAVDYNIKNPYSLQYSLTVERELFARTTLSVGYVGLRGENQLRGGSVNLATSVIQANGTPLFAAGAKRINPAWGDIDLKRADGNLWYNALQVGLLRRFSQGFQLQANYTFSRTIDDGSGLFFIDTRNSVSDPQNPFNNALERGLANYHVAHNFVANFSVALPTGRLSGVAGAILKDWQLNGIITLASGNPYTPGIVGDTAGALLRRPGQERPNIVGDPLSGTCPNGSPVGTAKCWYNPTAFALQPAGTFGNLGRNTLIGPGLANFDLAVTKNITARRSLLQFRAEAFNLFNHANLGAPDTNVFSGTGPDAGKVLPTAGTIFPPTLTAARQIQLGMKVLF